MSPREIKRVHVDFKTGEVSHQTHRTEEDATLKERIEGLRAVAGEMLDDPMIQETMTMICDGCGKRWPMGMRDFIGLPESLTDRGWTTNERGEFCEECSA